MVKAKTCSCGHAAGEVLGLKRGGRSSFESIPSLQSRALTHAAAAS